MNGADQLFVFLVCVLLGAASGVIYDFIFCLRYPFRSFWVRFAGDILYFILFALLYLFVTVLMQLPSLRLYTFAGCLMGLFLYLKSFHKIVAFFTERVYNNLRKLRARRNLCRNNRKECPKKN